MNLFPSTAWNAWFRIALILAGLCCSRGVAAEEQPKKPAVSEDALGFGDGGVESVPPGEGSTSANKTGPSRKAPATKVPVAASPGVPSTAPAAAPQGGAKGKPDAEPVRTAPVAGEGTGGAAASKPPESGKAVPAAASTSTSDTAPPPSDLLKMSREDLFQKIFMKPLPARLRDLVVHLVVDNENIEQIQVHWDEKFEDFRFHSGKLKAYLDSSLLRADSSRSLSSGEDYSGKLLKERRFGVQLDETEFALVLTIPPDLKKRQVRRIEDPAQDVAYGARIAPATFSAYLNSQWQSSWIYRERFFPNDSAKLFWERYNGGQAPERQPWSGDLDGAIRVWDWVLMGNGNLMEADSGSRHPVHSTRGETKLVHDFVPWNSRLTLLDVAPRHPGGNFSLPGLMGVDLNLGNSLYSRRGSNRAKVDVFLPRQATVTVYVNGEPVRSMQLGSGSQTIEGIPGRAGLNVGDVQIVYADGQVEHIPFEFTQSAPDVLPEGRQEGSFTAGVRRVRTDEYGTEPGDFVVAGTYLRGLSPFVNQKFGLAVSRGLQVANSDFLLIEDSVTSWNLVSTFSLDSSLKWGQRHDLQYSLKLPQGSAVGRLSYIQSRFRNAFFVPVAPQKAAVEVGLNLSRTLWKGALSTDLNVRFNRKLDSTTDPIDYHWNLTYSLQAYRGLNLRASAGFNVSSGEYAPSVSFTANYFFNAGHHSFFAMNQTTNQKRYVAPKIEQTRRRDSILVGGTMVFVNRDSSNFVPGSYQYAWLNQSTGGWSWSDGAGMNGGKSIALTGSASPDEYGLQASGQRTLNFADLGASYNLSDQNRQEIMSRSHYVMGRVASSLMFADGVFAVGRPVREGFLLVKGKQDLTRTSFRINPSDQNASEYSRGGPWNAASYGMMSAYQMENVQVVPDHTPGAVNLDGNLFTMENTFQQGYVLRLGRPAQVFVRVRLIDQASQPLSHTTFQVFSTADTAIPMYRSFSNDDGVIQIGGLEPGKSYIIRFGEDAFVKDLRITLPRNSPRIFDMGNVKVENQSLSQLSKVTLLTADPPTQVPRPNVPETAGGAHSQEAVPAALPSDPLPSAKSVN